MRAILQGKASDAQIAAFVLALNMKGETVEELAGFARALRESALPVDFQPRPRETLLDTCGTGGDGHKTFNISTTVAFVVAGCGVTVAKHGNRSVSSTSGSADVLEHLGVTVAVSGELAGRALREIGICFLFAPAFHHHLRQVQAVRRELRMRTTFNLLGPLCNPASPNAQMVGAPSLGSAARLAGAFSELGLERGYVVHGEDGLDEVTLSGPTAVFAVRKNEVQRMTVSPEDFLLPRAPVAELRGGSPLENAQITRAILDGNTGPQRDVVLINAAMALMAAQRAETPKDAVHYAAESIDSGAARRKLRLLGEFSGDQIAPL